MPEVKATLVELDVNEQMTPEQCLAFCQRYFAEMHHVVVLAYDEEGDLFIRYGSLLPFKRKDALWMFLEAQDWIRGVNQDA